MPPPSFGFKLNIECPFRRTWRAKHTNYPRTVGFRRAGCWKGKRVLKSKSMRLKCQKCSKMFGVSRKLPWCECGGMFDLEFKPAPLDIDFTDFTLWRYRSSLPVEHKVSLGEPITPIVSLELGGRMVGAKLEYLLPTGSFKDRGAAILISAMVDAGVDSFIEDSSGNAAAAMSA